MSTSAFPIFTLEVFFSIIGLYLLLRLMAQAVDIAQLFLANKFFPGLLAIGIEYIPELVKGTLIASIGSKFPVTDSKFVFTEIILEAADVMTCLDIASKRGESAEQY